MEFIFAKFPQSKGELPPTRLSQSEFECVFPRQAESSSPLPALKLFERIRLALSDADERLVRAVEQNKPSKYLLPRKKPIYAVADLPSGGVPLVPNQALDNQYTKRVNMFRSVGLSLQECLSLESLFRGQTEALSHSMWVLTGLLSLIRQEGFVPRDETLFHQFVSSLSIGLSHQANLSAAGTSFSCLKRRELYVSHLPPIYSESMKRSLLASPASLGSALFKPEDVERFSVLADRSSNIKSNQSVVEFMSGSARRSRSPRRSPSRPSSSSYVPRNRNSRSPSRSPKRVRFSSPRSTAKSPPPPVSNSNLK